MRMTYKEFTEVVENDYAKETIYEDSEGRHILVITLLDAYYMAGKLAPKLIDSKTEGEKDAVYKVTSAL
jgi:hypothetical protein